MANAPAVLFDDSQIERAGVSESKKPSKKKVEVLTAISHAPLLNAIREIIHRFETFLLQ